jgi:hypothetical protein
MLLAYGANPLRLYSIVVKVMSLGRERTEGPSDEVKVVKKNKVKGYRGNRKEKLQMFKSIFVEVRSVN